MNKDRNKKYFQSNKRILTVLKYLIPRQKIHSIFGGLKTPTREFNSLSTGTSKVGQGPQQINSSIRTPTNSKSMKYLLDLEHQKVKL